MEEIAKMLLEGYKLKQNNDFEPAALRAAIFRDFAEEKLKRNYLGMYEKVFLD